MGRKTPRRFTGILLAAIMSSLTLAPVAEANHSPLPHGWEEQVERTAAKVKETVPLDPSGVPLCVPTLGGQYCIVEWCVGTWSPRNPDPDLILFDYATGPEQYGIAYYPDISQPGTGVQAYRAESCDSTVSIET